MVTYGPHGKRADSWWGTTTPPTGPVGTSATWVGTVANFTVNGRICGFRAYINAGTSTDMVAVLMDDSFNYLGAYGFKDISAGSNRWLQTWCRPWHRITVGTSYLLYVLFPQGHYYRHNSQLSPNPITNNHIEFQNGFQSTALAAYDAGITGNTNANAVDFLFQPD
jgi:hypothetical protein